MLKPNVHDCARTEARRLRGANVPNKTATIPTILNTQMKAGLSMVQKYCTGRTAKHTIPKPSTTKNQHGQSIGEIAAFAHCAALSTPNATS